MGYYICGTNAEIWQSNNKSIFIQSATSNFELLYILYFHHIADILALHIM